MKRILSFLALALCLAWPARAQTTTGFTGDTLTVKRTMPPLGPGCFREVLLGASGAFLTRDTLCWVVRPTVPPPVVVDTPKPPIVVVPGRPAPLFEADWSTGPGTNQWAIKDSSKALPFDFCGGNAQVSVVPASTVTITEGARTYPNDFPARMQNVLRVTRNNIDSWFFCKIGTDPTGTTVKPHWPQLLPGQANYWRVYMRYDIPNDQGNISNSEFSHHPIQMPHNSSNFEPTNVFSRTDGTFTWQAYTFAVQNPYPMDKAVLGTFVSPADEGDRLPKFTALRFEWMVRRELVSGYSIAIRIYDNQDRLLYSEDGVGALKGAVKTETANAQSTLKSLDGKYKVDLTTLQSLGIGENGGHHSYTRDVYFYFGGLKLCADTWCGAY